MRCYSLVLLTYRSNYFEAKLTGHLANKPQLCCCCAGPAAWYMTNNNSYNNEGSWNTGGLLAADTPKVGKNILHSNARHAKKQTTAKHMKIKSHKKQFEQAVKSLVSPCKHTWRSRLCFYSDPAGWFKWSAYVAREKRSKLNANKCCQLRAYWILRNVY